MMNPSIVEKRKLVAKKLIEDALNKGEKIGGSNGRIPRLRELLVLAGEEYEYDKQHFDVISDVDLLEMYADIMECAKDTRATNSDSVLSTLTLQGTESVGQGTKGEGLTPPPVPMPLTSESDNAEQNADAGSVEGEDEEEQPSYEEDVRTSQPYHSNLS
jgi:hypothetical protein